MMSSYCEKYLNLVKTRLGEPLYRRKEGVVKNSPDHVGFSREIFEMADASWRANEPGRASFTENKTVESF